MGRAPTLILTITLSFAAGLLSGCGEKATVTDERAKQDFLSPTDLNSLTHAQREKVEGLMKGNATPPAAPK